MVSGVATYCMIIGLCIGLIIIAFIIHRTVKNKREKRKNKQEHSLEENSESQGDDPPIQQPHTSVQVDRPHEYAPDNNSLSPPPAYKQ